MYGSALHDILTTGAPVGQQTVDIIYSTKTEADCLDGGRYTAFFGLQGMSPVCSHGRAQQLARS